MKMETREILFRAIRSDTKTWVQGYYFKTPLTDENSGTTSDKGWFFLSDGQTRHCISSETGVAFVVDPSTLGQFTGLTDRNGVKIFEGDVLLFPDYDPNHEDEYKGYGVLEQCDWGWHITNRNDVDMRDLNGEDCEVICNIHQNPELL